MAVLLSRALRILLVLIPCTAVEAGGPLLVPTQRVEADPSMLPGYRFNTDQAFRFRSGPLRGKTIFFAEVDPEKATEPLVPRFAVSAGVSLVDSKVLPTLEPGWNIVSVEAVSVVPYRRMGSLYRVLAILTLEPASGRPDDYWTQPFALDLRGDGVVRPNSELNQKLLKVRTSLKTIKTLSAYLKKHPE